MDGRHFDELTRKLAGGISRRQVLRTLAGGVAAVGAALGRRSVTAAPSTCAVGCAGLPGPQKAACKQACRQCGGDFDRVCFEEGPFGPISFSCCPEGTFCVFGAGICCEEGTQPCFGPEGNTCCPAGTFCNFETGECISECPADSGCLGPDCAPGCFCVSSVEGNGACVSGAFANCEAQPCDTSADCGDGGNCVDVSSDFCCSGVPSTRICFPPEAICEIGAGAAAGAREAPSWRR